jgi:hypothetical protein
MAEKKSQSSSKSASSKSSASSPESQTQVKGGFDQANMKTQTEVNNADKTALVSDETRNNLTESEKSALELQEAALSNGEIPSKLYTLKNPNTQYTDPENGWTLTRDEVKELPEFPSSETLERIKAGFIVEADGPAAAATGTAQTQEEQPAEVTKPDGE